MSQSTHRVSKIQVAVAGASGYSGQDLVQLLKNHPRFELCCEIGRDFISDSSKRAQLETVDLVFLATPNEVSMELVQALRALPRRAGPIKIVDLSGSFRLTQSEYPTWYGFEHRSPELLNHAHYGLFPFAPPHPQTTLVANPGCYATAALLGLIPALRSHRVEERAIVIDAKSGTTGAGRKAELHLSFSELAENFYPYRIGRHQHFPEIQRYLQTFVGRSAEFSFVTSLLPVRRGIQASLFFSPIQGQSVASSIPHLVAAYQAAYKDDPGISVGTEESHAQLARVVRSNRVHIGVYSCFERVLVSVCIDNLQRGAAGQALMNANALFGLSPQLGLE